MRGKGLHAARSDPTGRGKATRRPRENNNVFTASRPRRAGQGSRASARRPRAGLPGAGASARRGGGRAGAVGPPRKPDAGRHKTRFYIRVEVAQSLTKNQNETERCTRTIDELNNSRISSVGYG